MRLSVLLILILVFMPAAHADPVRYELTIRKEAVNMSGKKEVDFALTVNGGIPAPTLEFTEGDDAEILVKNELSDQEVSIHWHGILLPPEEDGVPYVNTPPIHPGSSRLFQFKLRQNGTYWYHSHTGLQEQKGVYGAFIVHPKKKALAYDKEAVLVLSDWSDESADQILRNLKKDGDYYLYKKDSVRSYFGAIKSGGLKSHLQNEWERMGGMDLSDVAYDAFLINGKPDSQLLTAHPGETIRLRIINAAASSYFYVAMGVPMTVISADGVDVEPLQAHEILMGMAETYDVLFTIPEQKNYEIRATVQDVTGSASAWIGAGEKVFAPDKSFPNLYESMDHGGHAGGDHDHHAAMDHNAHGGGAMGHDQHSAMDHSRHVSVSTEPAASIDWSSQSGAMLRQNAAHRSLDIIKASSALTTLSVDHLKSLEPTTLPQDAPVHDVRLVLGGDMDRYVWHINGKTIQQDRLLMIKTGDVVRFTFDNETMMHHPMHFHGHFFRVITDSGERSPLKHTVDVPPHASRTIEFYANEPGQWMLHCHNLYHMDTGMAKVVRYSDFKLTPNMEKYDPHDPHLHNHRYTHAVLEAGSNHAKAQFRLIRSWDEIILELETANIDGKNFAIGEDWETEGDLVYQRWFSRFLNLFGGGTLYHGEGYATLGLGYMLPMLLESRVSVQHEGKFRLDLEKRFQWTKSIFTDAEVSWRPDWGGERDTEFEISLMYGPSWYWAAGLMVTENSVGLGAQVQF